MLNIVKIWMFEFNPQHRDVPRSLRSRIADQFESFSELREVTIGGGQGRTFTTKTKNGCKYT